MSKRKITGQRTLDNFFSCITRSKKADRGGEVAREVKVATVVEMDPNSQQSSNSTISGVAESNSCSQHKASQETGVFLLEVMEIFKQTSSVSQSKKWDVWDNDHVRFPASKRCFYPAPHSNSNRSSPSKSSEKFVSKWDTIKEAFRNPIKSTYELEEAIASYNTHNKNLNFENLHYLFNSEMSAPETKEFFNQVLPNIISMALSIPDFFDGPIPLLHKELARSVTLTQQQLACILANFFLCTFPRQPDNFPFVNFTRLFSSGHHRRTSEIHLRDKLKVEKLKFIINYFRRITVDLQSRSNYYVTFARHCLAKLPNWDNFTQQLANSKIYSEGTIESDGIGMLQMDFANSFIGGGVLTDGSVQEEIRFLICPELLVSLLFTERMEDNEAVVITGAERFSSYSGYGSTLRFAGDYIDPTPRDAFGRIDTRIVAADAIAFFGSMQQFQPEYVKRELNKALVAFHPVLKTDGEPSSFNQEQASAVATGNWGCGAFGGDPKIKFLIQLLASSVAGRDLVYFTFLDFELQNELQTMYTFLSNRKMTVCQVYKLLLSYYSNVVLVSPRNRPAVDLYSFIYQQFSK